MRHRTVRAARPATRSATLLCLALLAACGLLFGTAGPAAAHAQLEKTSPGENAVVKTAPKRVTLTFGESVTLRDKAVRVFGPDGKRVDRGAPGHVGGKDSTASIALHKHLPKGTFTVAWRVTSADTHVVSGAFTFSFGKHSAAKAPASVSQSSQDPLVGAAYTVARWGAYAAFALLLGCAAFCLTCWTRAVRQPRVLRLLYGSWAGLLACTVALLLLYGPQSSGAGITGVADPSLWKAALDSRLGVALGVRVLLLAAAAGWLRLLTRRPDARGGHRGVLLSVTGALLACALVATWAAVDHAATGIQTAVALPADMIHLLAMGVWLGGLLTLLLTLRQQSGLGPVAPIETVRRFSRIALGCVLALVVTGVYQSWRQTGSIAAVLDTTYGKLLLAKVALVALLVVVAARSRRWVHRIRTCDSGNDGDNSSGAEEHAEEQAAPPVGVATRHESETPDDPPGHPTAPPSTQPENTQSENTRRETAQPDNEQLDPTRRAQLQRQQAARQEGQERRADRRNPGPAELRRSVLWEAGLAALVLAVTTVLTNTSPGRVASGDEPSSGSGQSAAASPGQHTSRKATIPFDTGGTHGHGTVRLALDPGTAGDNEIHLRVRDRHGHALNPPELTLAFTLKDKHIGPITVTPKRSGAGRYRVRKATLPMPGRWTVAVTVRTSPIDEVTENAAVGVRPGRQ